MSTVKSTADVDALFFDVFGTLVDWRGSIARDAKALVGRDLDGEAFADAWRGEYQTSMEPIRRGQRPYTRLDVLHRENLDRVLPRFGLDDLDESKRAQLNMLWHKLDSWPDVVPAMIRLQKRFKLAPASNGSIPIMVDIARHNGMPWDAILGADIAKSFKPNHAVYLACAEALDLPPDRCMMVAAHSADLAAAAAAGLKTGFVGRPNEYGIGKGETRATFAVDAHGDDLGGLADTLGA